MGRGTVHYCANKKSSYGLMQPEMCESHCNQHAEMFQKTA